jgi:hypothetical protein
MTGIALARLWRVHVRHALYHKDGTWYNNLTSFPGALFDPDGYVLFQREQDYQACRHLTIGKETNVRGGVKQIPGYRRMKP